MTDDSQLPKIGLEDVVRMAIEGMHNKDTNREWLEKNRISEETIKFLANTFYMQVVEDILKGKQVEAAIQNALCCMFQVGWDMCKEMGPIRSQM